MQLAESGRIRRVLPLLILALPLLAGAVYAGVKPMFGVTDRVPTVAVVANPGNGTTPAAKMVSALTGNQDFDWLVTDADQAAAGMNDGSVLATVTVPDGFGKPGQDADSRRIAVVPGHTDLDAATYANLVRDVSASAAQVGVGDLLVGVSKARNGLADAQFTAGVIKTAANQAGDAFNNAFGTIDQLMAKAAPMLQSAQGMAATIRQLSGTVNDVSEKLALAATGLRGLNLTIGDIQNGANALGATADSTAQALTATGPLRTQLRTVLAPIAGALQMSGIPDAQKMATQITSLLDLVAGPSNPGVQLAGAADGARMLANQLNDLSGLVGARVTPTTKVSDVFTLGANRLRELGMFMTQGEKMLSEVVGQVGSATGQVPEMKGTIKTQLDQFKTVASQLVSQLNASAAAMPRTSAPNAGAAVSDPVALDESGGNAIGENVTRTVLVLLVGALLIALLRTWLVERLAQRGRADRAGLVAAAVCGVLVLGLAGVGLAVLGTVARADAAFAILVLAAAALAAVAVAVLRLLSDRTGVVVWMVLIAAAAVVRGGIEAGHGPAGNLVHRLLPSSYAASGLNDAAAIGIGSEAALPIVVLTTLGMLALGATILAARRPQGVHALSRQ